MNKVRITVAGMAVAGLATVLAPVAAQADTGAAAWQGSCAKGDFCVWSGKDGTGTRCAWNGDDPDWYGGSVQCKPKFLVASYWNNGYTGSYSKVKVYTLANYKYYWGTISAGKRANFWEGQPMGSHKWVN
ncbi:hypothetical protein E1293_27540 [Actinomadura darangshiensis]|uniref:Peptidase inhibitor family I36 protein n=1 Tax=Actinomadura darangshiensis TaxID=705336 RepID=A0A4R5AY46_9ACTN|nr:peptidase inhibitor family I36 protein [Actinomadura darangshiensis]TDD76154.1 hypothetical protein E1293_27540 [Actinomadura darangshiensis]